MKNLIYFWFILFFIFFSCNKKEKNTNNNLSNSELLTAHPWIGVKVIRYVNGVETTSSPITNNKYIFTKDSHYKKYENGVILENGTWELFEHSVILIRTRYFSTSLNHNVLNDLNVIELSSQNLWFSMPVIDGSNNVLRDDYYYKK